MSWLLPVMALDMVDEAVVNVKVVHMLPMYSSIVIMTVVILAIIRTVGGISII